MKNLKKLISLVVMLVMSFSLMACSGANSKTTGETSEKVPEETIKIAVEIYDPTDLEFIEMQEYFKYLQETFNVEFIYSEAIASAEEELQFIENAAVSGAKAVIGYYNISKAEVISKTIELGMYYYGASEYKDVYEQFKDNEYYLGSITYGDGDFEAGYNLGKYFLDQGLTKLVYASGGADFGVELFVNRRKGFLKAVEEAKAAGKEVTVIDVSGFPGDSFFAGQTSALTQDIEAVCASFAGADFWIQPIATAGKTGQVKLGTIGALSDTYKEAFENGTVDYLASANIQRFGIAAAMCINAVTGNADALKKDGVATDLVQGYWSITNSDEYNEIAELVYGDEKVYSGEELKTIVKVANPDANAKTLEDLVGSWTLEDIQVRKAK